MAHSPSQSRTPSASSSFRRPYPDTPSSDDLRSPSYHTRQNQQQTPLSKSLSSRLSTWASEKRSPTSSSPKQSPRSSLKTTSSAGKDRRPPSPLMEEAHRPPRTSSMIGKKTRSKSGPRDPDDSSHSASEGGLRRSASRNKITKRPSHSPARVNEIELEQERQMVEGRRRTTRHTPQNGSTSSPSRSPSRPVELRHTHSRSNLSEAIRPAFSPSSGREFLHPQRSASESSPRRSPLSPHSVDIKRLLSKPALPFASASNPSDSDSYGDGSTPRSALRSPREQTRTRSDGPRERPLPSPPVELFSNGRRTSVSGIVTAGEPSRPRNVLRRKTSGVSKKPSLTLPVTATFGPRSPARSGKSPSPSPALREDGPLTPAGAVAQAYMQQEKRRSDVEAFYNTNAPSSEWDISHEEEESATPYYTVLGSTSGRVVAVGSPEDDAWNLDNCRYTPFDDRARSGSSKDAGGMRSLSRKMSSKFRRPSMSGHIVRKDEPSPGRRCDGDSGRSVRPSLQERRSESRSRNGRTRPSRHSLHLSIDGHVDPQRPGLPLPAMTPRDDAFDKFAKKDEDTGKKLWKLMKRISTGGMRERYQSSTSHDAPPPVPALPKGIIARDPESPGMISRFIQSRPSMTSTSVSVQPKAKLVSGPASAGGNRPSTTTRSSSPGSSDVASSRFFHRSHSTRSSSSSYGEELIPPMPSNAHLAQHILSPTELHRLHRDYDVPQSKTSPSKSAIRMPKRATTAPGNWTSPSPMVERPSLPFPPRRQTSDKRASISSQESSCSPILPSFSIVDAVNTFEPRRPSMGSKERLPGPSEPGPSDRRPSLTVIVPNSDFGGENPSPPPRPRKSSRRVPPPTLTPSRTPPQTPLLKVAPEGSPPDKRKSSGTHSSSSTARQQHRHTRSSSFGPSSSQASKSPLTFREMGSAAPRAAPLTEKEKSERWDDLLERSARAGGTIHMGGQELMSDKIRFSNISEMW